MNDPRTISLATIEAEEQLIGAILIDASTGSKEGVNTARATLTPADFRQTIHQQIFSAMLACTEAPHQINTARQMAAMGTLAGDVVAHLSHCISVTGGLDYEAYAQAVKEYSQRRGGAPPSRVRGLQL